MSLLPVEEAIRLVLANVPEPVPEAALLDAAGGRVLFEPLIARRNQPPFAASAMDGYAVRAADIVVGTPLRMIGVSQAGQRFTGKVEAGCCVRIFTGAPLPIGADAVIMQEEAENEGDLVRFTTVPAPGRSVRPEGNDFRAGQVLLPSGTLLGPAQILLAAAANTAELMVAQQPRIAILSTGDELVPPGGNPGPDQIIASNTAGLKSLLAPYSGRIADLGIVPDDRAAIAAALSNQLAGAADILLVSGGASVGDRDYLRDVLVDLGVELQFWKIAMRPGKPMMFGKKGDVLIFGLPGNPVSAMVTAEIIVKPALRGWLGFRQVEGTRLRLPLAADLPPNGPRRHFLRGIIETREVTRVRPISETDSGHTSSLAEADVVIVQPENSPALPAGSVIEAIPLRGF